MRKKIKDSFPDGKKLRSYPSIKIGRFVVAKDYQSQHIGAHLMSIIKTLLSDENDSTRLMYFDMLEVSHR